MIVDTSPSSTGSVVAALANGEVVAIPTDTVYGLAVDPRRDGATAALYQLKGRPDRVEIPVLVADVAQAAALARDGAMTPTARLLAERFWPGPLTLVVARNGSIHWDLGGAGDTIGLRCPDDAWVRGLCVEVGPLAVTSANRHGRTPCHDARSVTAEFGDRLLVADAGRRDAPPSTVVDTTVDPVACLRPGALSWAEVLEGARRSSA